MGLKLCLLPYLVVIVLLHLEHREVSTSAFEGPLLAALGSTRGGLRR